MGIADIFTMPGIGGLIVCVVMLTAAAIYLGLTRWILQGGEDKEPWDKMGWPFE